MILIVVAILFAIVALIAGALFAFPASSSSYGPKLLEFDSESVNAFALARRSAVYHNRRNTDPVDLLHGILLSGLPESARFAAHLKLGGGELLSTVEALRARGEVLVPEGAGLSDAVKKILASAHGKAQKDKCCKVEIYHFVYGLIHERPRDVERALAAAGKTWQDLKEYENRA